MARKTHNLTFRVYPSERVALDRICAIEGRGLADVLRDLVREGAARRGLWPLTDDAKEHLGQKEV